MRGLRSYDISRQAALPEMRSVGKMGKRKKQGERMTKQHNNRGFQHNFHVYENKCVENCVYFVDMRIDGFV